MEMCIRVHDSGINTIGVYSQRKAAATAELFIDKSHSSYLMTKTKVIKGYGMFFFVPSFPPIFSRACLIFLMETSCPTISVLFVS